MQAQHITVQPARRTARPRRRGKARCRTCTSAATDSLRTDGRHVAGRLRGAGEPTHLRGIGDGLKQKHLALARIALQGFEQRRAHLRIDKSTHGTARCTPLASAPFGQYGPVHMTHWTSSKRCVLQHRTMTWLHERTTAAAPDACNFSAWLYRPPTVARRKHDAIPDRALQRSSRPLRR